MKKFTAAVSLGLVFTAAAAAQRPQPRVVTTIAGEAVYDVLPPGTIPAIDQPTFVTGKAAAAQMRPDVGETLQSVAVTAVYWFAWSGFYANTQVLDPASPPSTP